MNGIKQIAYFGISTLFLKVLGFALLPITTRILSQAEFGELNFLVSISAVVSLLLCLGLPDLLFKQQMTNPQHKRALFRDALVVCAIVSSVFVCVVFYCIEYLSALLPVSLNILDIKLLAINLALSSLLSILFCYFRYYEKAKEFCILAVLQGMGQTVLTVVLLYFGHGVTGVMASGVASSALVLCIALTRVMKPLGISFKRITWRISYKNGLFLISIVISSLFVYANNGAENWFIVASEGKEKLAQYYVALQFAVMTSFTFEPIRMWWFSRRFDELAKNRERYIDLCSLCLDSAILLCALMLIITPSIFSLVLPQNYQLHTWLLPSLIFIVVIKHHSDLLNVGCYIHYNGAFVTVVNAVSALAVLALLAVLVPRYNVYGVVVSLCIAQLIKTCLLIIISQKLENLTFSVKRLLPSWACFLVIYLLSITQTTYFELVQCIVFICFLIALFYKYKPEILTLTQQTTRGKVYD